MIRITRLAETVCPAMSKTQNKLKEFCTYVPFRIGSLPHPQNDVNRKPIKYHN